MTVTSVADAYLSACPVEVADRAPLDAALRQAIADALREVPGLEVSEPDAAAAMARAGLAPDDLDPGAVVEIVIAVGCAAGHPRAVEAFEERYVSRVGAAVAHMKLPADVVDELRQVVRDKLLVAPSAGEPPRLVRYAGKGTLPGLIKVAAVREAIGMLRKEARARPAADDLSDLPAPEVDPELAFLKRRYRDAFKIAFEAAVRGLERRDRNLLRLHLVGDVTLDDIARMYGVHRTTIVRSLQRVRKRLLSETRKALRHDLEVDAAELESVMDLIRSRLDASVERWLRTEESDPPQG